MADLVMGSNSSFERGTRGGEGARFPGNEVDGDDGDDDDDDDAASASGGGAAATAAQVRDQRQSPPAAAAVSHDEALAGVRSEAELDALLQRSMVSASEVQRARTEWLRQSLVSPSDSPDVGVVGSTSQPDHGHNQATSGGRRGRGRGNNAATTTTNAGANTVGADADAVRFDLEGRIISRGGDPAAAQAGRSRADAALFHHGGDQRQAGYTFEELEHIMLSTFPPQRSMGLKVVGAILRRWEDRSDGLRLSLRVSVPESTVAALAYALRYSCGTTANVRRALVRCFASTVPSVGGLVDWLRRVHTGAGGGGLRRQYCSLTVVVVVVVVVVLVVLVVLALVLDDVVSCLLHINFCASRGRCSTHRLWRKACARCWPCSKCTATAPAATPWIELIVAHLLTRHMATATAAVPVAAAAAAPASQTPSKIFCCDQPRARPPPFSRSLVSVCVGPRTTTTMLVLVLLLLLPAVTFQRGDRRNYRVWFALLTRLLRSLQTQKLPRRRRLWEGEP